MLRKLAVASAALAPVFLASAVAQTPSTANVFDADYFSQFSPTTAHDMVRQLPGFSIDSGDTVRGFGGAAGNVLINGERPATKERIEDILRRIPAATVTRIEIVTSASGALDMRGQTKVANVIVTTDSSERAPVNWRLFLRHIQGGVITAQTEANTSLSVFGGDLALSVSAGQTRLQGPGTGTRDYGGRDYFNGAGVQFEQHTSLYHNEDLTIEPAFQFNRKFDWGTLRLNGKYDGCCGTGDSFVTVRAPDANSAIIRYETTDSENDSPAWTFGGDIERSLGSGASAKLIFLNDRSEKNSTNLFEYFDSAGAFDRSVLVDSDNSSGETILRGQTQWKLGENHDVGVALEGAYNFLDSTRTVTLDTGFNATPPGSDTIVEELRGEFELSDIWTISPQLTLEPIFKFEVSRIRQEVRLNPTTSFIEERDFTYPKPGISATWRPAEQKQVRLSLQREVAQLNFSDFVSSLEVNNDFVTSGNTNLEPAKTWALDGQYETDFWGDGVLTFRASHDWVEDVQDLVCVVPVTNGPPDPTPCIQRTDSFDGPGNIGSGTQWSAGVNLSLPLDSLGVSGGRLTIDYRNGQSSVTDPVTGETRRFTNAFGWRGINLEFRQDLPALQFSYGFDLSDDSGATAYRLRETFRRERTGTNLDLFVETTRFLGLNIRAGYNDVLETEYQSKRVVYDAPRSSGVPILYQNGYGRNGPFAYIRFAGSF